jgi:hypothetical protein
LKGLEIQLVGYAENTKRSKKSQPLRMTALWGLERQLVRYAENTKRSKK